jgi:hypothetical protein
MWVNNIKILLGWRGRMGRIGLVWLRIGNAVINLPVP